MPIESQHRWGGEGRLFSEGFQDTILFRDGQLANMFHYLADNPRRRAIKALFLGLFRVVGELAVPLRLPPREPDVADRAVPRARARGWFAALGNRFLLERPLAQVQVSRSDFRYKRIAKPGVGLKIARTAEGEPIVESASPGYAEKKAVLFAAAKHGGVLISPCVSDGERQIAREALAAGFPLVTLQNKGFSPLQKPSGRYFDACAEGRLLMLAPAAWPFLPGEKTMTRADATAMNRLCQWIVGEDAAVINYHGLRPADIDVLQELRPGRFPSDGAAGEEGRESRRHWRVSRESLGPDYHHPLTRLDADASPSLQGVVSAFAIGGGRIRNLVAGLRDTMAT